jgi:hypothetical protein
VTRTPLGTTQQGPKLVGTGAVFNAHQSGALAVSADGNTLAVGGTTDNNDAGATWVFVRSGTTWGQQGPKLVGTGNVNSRINQGFSVALSADGNTLAASGYLDDNGTGATWVFVRSGTTWSQQGPKLVGTGANGQAYQGTAVRLSADGNTLAVGGYHDNNYAGATWVFTRSGTTWSQQGPKLVGTGAVGSGAGRNEVYQGGTLALSADGNTLAVGGNQDNFSTGATWVFTRSGTTWSQQGPKLVGTGAVNTASQASSIALAADANTLAIGGPYDNSGVGAAWIFTRSGTTWSQRGAKIVPFSTSGIASLGASVSLSADGGTLVSCGPADTNGVGAAWVFNLSGPSNKLVGTGAVPATRQGTAIALSADGGTLAVGGPADNADAGATWVFSTASAVLAQNRAAVPLARAHFFPNPVTEQLTITGGANVGTLRLLDGLGRTLLSLPYHKGQPVRLASLAPGLYWLRVDQGAAQPLFKQ